ncbi:unnamed protein product [Nezara viridula]|uniref:ZZ-type domain-containing protein n=1 Tax=Nezara viridula TaxID=85310 RepID=A0A9P0H4V7_NEZVI|nr:unnamed protein product [Nezara viridula]
MSLDFKVYLQTPDGDEVIRRICIPGLDFGYLRHEICYRFSISKYEHFSLCWKDNEGDKIRINTERELEIALNETSSSPIKLYVILQGQQDHPSDHLKKNGPVHSTVNCDECGLKSLQGYRYKCLVCHNYDLCTNCEKSERIHSEHPMVRIPVPLNGEQPFGRKYQNVKDNIYGTMKYLLENS